MGSALEALQELSRDLARRAGSYVVLEVGEIVADPDQPRTSLSSPSESAEALTDLQELAASIGRIGILQPLLVRRDDETGTYVLIAGERRWRAAQIAGLSEVPCIVLEGEHVLPAQRALRSITENIQRKNLTLAETVQALSRLVGDLGMEQREVAEMLGVSASWISQYLAIRKAEGPAKQALEEGLLTDRETFRVFGKLPAPQQSRLLEDARKAKQPIGRRAAEGALEATKPRSPRRPGGPSRPAPFGKPDARVGPRDVTQPTASAETPMYFLPALTRGQLERLFALLGSLVPEDPTQIGAALLQALNPER